MEIERKFLINNYNYKSLAYKSYHILQAYPSIDENCTVRIRLCGNKGFITIKVDPMKKVFVVTNGIRKYRKVRPKS